MKKLNFSAKVMTEEKIIILCKIIIDDLINIDLKFFSFKFFVKFKHFIFLINFFQFDFSLILMSLIMLLFISI